MKQLADSVDPFSTSERGSQPVNFEWQKLTMKGAALEQHDKYSRIYQEI